ncbi:MAG: GGDEF domain-containing protein [Candidatus Omnitrophica bacterium]|nr:GGDEF domain-containing protein [Candidatus Omnitrophota bacterium]
MPKTSRLNRETISPKVVAAYQELTQKIMHFRVSVLVPIGSVFLMVFSYVDQNIFPPEHQWSLLIMRILTCTLFLCLYVLSRFERFKRSIVWLVDLGALSNVAFLCFVIYKTEGASGRYYEGIIQSMWAWFFANSFYYRHHVLVGSASLILYTIATLANPPHWSLGGYVYSMTLMTITLVYLALVTKFYASEFFYGFVRNETLKESERKLEEMNRKLALLYRRADEMSKIDDLTKIYNRRYFFEILTDKVKRCREEGSFFYLAIVDIDYFKRINDTFGHRMGDEVIRAVAKTLTEKLRVNSFLGRYGGDEFMIIIDKADKEVFLKRIQEVQEAIRNMKIVQTIKNLEVSLSVGAIKVDPKKFDKVFTAVDLADKALLEVKQTKRGEIKLVE